MHPDGRSEQTGRVARLAEDRRDSAEEHPASRAGSGASDDSGPARVVSRQSPYSALLTFAAACVVPILYLAYIDRFATNSFYGDDWSVAPMVRGTLDNHFSPGQLWAQYNESRLVLGNITDIVFGYVDHLDLRSVLFFSAALLIAS